MTTTEDPMPDAPAALVPPATTPADLVERPRHRASWTAVAAIAIASAGGGVLVGSRLRGSTPPPPPGMAGMPGMDSDAPARPANAGSNAVYISPGRQQLVGVRTALVDRQRVEGTVRTVGMLAYDETRTAQIHTRVSGWVEQLFVDYVGKAVRRGQPLFAVYSPDLATSQADYLVALKASQRLGDSTNVDLKAGADALLAASRERMKRWDVSDAQIAELERAGHATRTMTIASPFDGVVLEKNAFAGQYITPDMTTFKLADLSTIWVVGQMFEYEAARIHPGDTIDVEFPYGQTPKLQARIEFVYPEVDPQTRRVRFRAVLPNADRKLKPDTYVTLVWHGEAKDRVVVPKEAVIDTGERKYVLLALADGYFEPRDVQVGPPIGELYPVVGGVAAGDRVVTSSQFLIDSETNLMAAMQGMAMSMPGMDMGKPATTTGIAAPADPSMPDMPGMPGMKITKPAPAAGSAAPADPSMPDMPGMPGMKMTKPAPAAGSAAPARPSMPGMPGM
jgi:membrane fusion protein, copper/silver efflux system